MMRTTIGLLIARVPLRLIGTIAGLGLIAEAPATAQESDGPVEREDIVVLGTRTSRDATLSSDRTTELLSQSSRSLEQDLLRAAGTYRLSDALELVSGSSQQNNRGGFADNFAIRGFLSTADGGGEYYTDGFVANRGSAPARDPATIERIEILKGPAGAVFGDIDPAGRVNMVSKTPRFAPQASATVHYGSFDTRRIELDATGPVTGTVAARIVVATENSDGYRDFVTLKRRVVSPSVTFRPSDTVQLTYLAQHIAYDAPFDRGVAAVAGDPLALPASRFLGEPSNGATRARDTRHQLTGEAKVGGTWSLVGGVAFAPELGHGFEIGMAGRWRGVDVGVTWFDIQKSNVLTTDPKDANFLAPVGSLRSRGVEFDASLRLASRWQAVVNYAWTRARNDDRSFATPLSLNVPDHSGTALLVHCIPIGSGRTAMLGGGIAYVGKRSGATDASALMLPDYWKVKASTEVPLSAALTVRAEVDNLFDARYAQSSYNSLWIYPGAPRTLRASLRAMF